MSTPLLTQLLEEAGERCTELSARAMAGTAAAGEVIEHANALGLKAVEEAERLHKEYTEATEAIKHASAQAAQAAEAAGHSVESVTTETLKAATAMKDMLVEVEADVAHLGQERSRLLHDLDESAHQADTGFKELAAQVKEFEEHIEAKVKESETALAHVQDVVRAVTTGISTAQQDLEVGLHQAGSLASHATSVTAHALDQILAAISGGLLKFSNDAIAGHNLAVAAVRLGYLDQTKEEPEPASTYLGGAFDKVRDALHAFEQVPDPAQSALQTATTAILGEGEKAVNGLAEAAQDLQHSVQVVTP